jgi:hypothetical protein
MVLLFCFFYFYFQLVYSEKIKRVTTTFCSRQLLSRTLGNNACQPLDKSSSIKGGKSENDSLYCGIASNACSLAIHGRIKK